jgi:integrase
MPLMPKSKGQVKRIKNGVWMMRVETNKNGERKSVSKRYPSKEKADEALKLLLKQLEQPVPTDRHDFAELFDAYLKFIQPTIAEQTYHLYKRTIDNHLKPTFGSLSVREITSHAIDMFYADLQQTLAGATVVKIHNQLKAALKKARGWRWIDENPMDFVRAPSRKTKPSVTNRRHEPKDVLTPEEIDRFIDACGDLRTKCLWLFFALSGARASEVFAARWKDLDLEKNVFNLQQKLVQTKQVKKFDVPKTEKSTRSIPFPAWFVELLRKLKTEQNKIRLKSLFWEDNDLVFATAYGKPLRLSNLGEKCYKICDSAGIKKHVTPHSFRHSFATNARRNGVDLKDISEFLGHSSIRITSDIYSHVSIDDKRKTSEIVSNLIKMR